MSHHLISGDPVQPSGCDYIAQIVHLPVENSPEGLNRGNNSGWRIITGNNLFNTWARVVLRYEIQE